MMWSLAEMTKIEAKDSEYFEIQRSPSCEIHGKKKKEKKTCIYTRYIHWWVMLVKIENTRKKKSLRISFKFCHNPLKFRVHFNYFFLLERQNNIYSNQRCVFCL